MRRWWLWLLIGVLAVGSVLAVKAGRGDFRRNRLRYLVNDHQYLAALNGYGKLAAESGRDPIPGFETDLLRRAHDYYGQLNLSRGSSEERTYQAFLDAAILRGGELAPEARRQRLELLSSRDGATTPTLAAAEEILQHGYDPEALWWAVRCQYDPGRPLKIPKRLLDFGERVTEPPARGAEVSAKQAARLRYLNALLDLAHHNWAGAAALFASGPSPDALDDGMAIGIALLRAGRPEAAIEPLERERRQRPSDPLPLEWLAEAYLGAGRYAWALQALRELAGIDAAAVNRALAEAFPAAPVENTFAALCAESADKADVGLWDFLARLEPQSNLPVEAASRLLAVAPLNLDELAVLGEAALRRGNAVLLAGIEDRLQKLNDPAAARLSNVLHGAKPRGAQRLSIFLSANATQHAPIVIPPGTRIMVIEAQSSPAGATWPVVHVDLGKLGRRTIDASESRAQARPTILILPENAGGKVELSASLLNASAGLNVMLTQALMY